MSDCDRFETCIDQRFHGALEADDAKALEMHLPGCASCRAYETALQKIDHGLHALSREASAVDWDRFERALERRRRSQVQRFLIGILLGAIAVAIAAWGLAAPGQAAAFALKMGSVVATIIAVRVLFTWREVRRLARIDRGEDLIEAHRLSLEGRLRTMRRLRWVAVAVVVRSVLSAFGAGETREAVTHVGLAAIVAGSWLYTFLVSQPRMRREIAELDPKGRA